MNGVINIFPKQQVSVRGQFEITKTIELNTWLRYVDGYSTIYLLPPTNGEYHLDRYITMDLRLGWKIEPKIELSLVGRNLVGGDHVEFVQEAFSRPAEIQRSFYGKLIYKF